MNENNIMGFNHFRVPYMMCGCIPNTSEIERGCMAFQDIQYIWYGLQGIITNMWNLAKMINTSSIVTSEIKVIPNF